MSKQEIASHIDASMTWVSTCEGHSFWSALNNRLNGYGRPPTSDEPPRTTDPAKGIRDKERLHAAYVGLRALGIEQEAQRALLKKLRALRIHPAGGARLTKLLLLERREP